MGEFTKFVQMLHIKGFYFKKGIVRPSAGDPREYVYIMRDGWIYFSAWHYYKTDRPDALFINDDIVTADEAIKRLEAAEAGA